MKTKLQYVLWAARNVLRSDTSCPACGSKDGGVIKVKHLVTKLVECKRCSLRFRIPKDDPDTVNRLYAQEEYKQGFTTDLPSDTELDSLLVTNFAGTEKDFAYRIHVLRFAGLAEGARLLDFGSSWGYGSWQMRQAGYDVYSFEIGKDRAQYAKDKLGCHVVEDLRQLDGQIDCFFSADVIEHLPDPNLLFDEARQVLRQGGLLVCYCPNGSKQRERVHPRDYHQNWGMVHPVFITPEYLRHAARETGFDVEMIRSDSWEWGNSGQNPMEMEDRLSGSELLFIAKKL